MQADFLEKPCDQCYTEGPIRTCSYKPGLIFKELSPHQHLNRNVLLTSRIYSDKVKMFGIAKSMVLMFIKMPLS